MRLAQARLDAFDSDDYLGKPCDVPLPWKDGTPADELKWVLRGA